MPLVRQNWLTSRCECTHLAYFPMRIYRDLNRSFELRSPKSDPDHWCSSPPSDSNCYHCCSDCRWSCCRWSCGLANRSAPVPNCPRRTPRPPRSRCSPTARCPDTVSRPPRNDHNRECLRSTRELTNNHMITDYSHKQSHRPLTKIVRSKNSHSKSHLPRHSE